MYLSQMALINRYSIKTNSYGDKIVSCETIDALDNFLKSDDCDKTKKIVLKTSFEVNDKIIAGIFYFTLKKDGYYYYITKILKPLCFKTIDNLARASLLVLIVNDHFIYVRDVNGKQALKPPGGACNVFYDNNSASWELSEDCAIREANEECGISKEHLTNIKFIGYYSVDVTMFDTKFESNNNIYFCRTTVSEKEFDAIKKFSSDEIKYVIANPIENIIKLAHHHNIIIDFIYFTRIKKVKYTGDNNISYLKNGKINFINDF